MIKVMVKIKKKNKKKIKFKFNLQKYYRKNKKIFSQIKIFKKKSKGFYN